jgi:hypothetical protein
VVAVQRRGVDRLLEILDAKVDQLEEELKGPLILSIPGPFWVGSRTCNAKPIAQAASVANYGVVIKR